MALCVLVSPVFLWNTHLPEVTGSVRVIFTFIKVLPEALLSSESRVLLPILTCCFISSLWIILSQRSCFQLKNLLLEILLFCCSFSPEMDLSISQSVNLSLFISFPPTSFFLLLIHTYTTLDSQTFRHACIYQTLIVDQV